MLPSQQDWIARIAPVNYLTRSGSLAYTLALTVAAASMPAAIPVGRYRVFVNGGSMNATTTLRLAISTDVTGFPTDLSAGAAVCAWRSDQVEVIDVAEGAQFVQARLSSGTGTLYLQPIAP